MSIHENPGATRLPLPQGEGWGEGGLSPSLECPLPGKICPENGHFSIGPLRFYRHNLLICS